MPQRLSRMQTLPEEALPIAQWAHDAIMSRRMTNLVIHAQVNDRLGKLGLAPISSSGFGRYAQAVRGGSIQRPRPLASAPDIQGMG